MVSVMKGDHNIIKTAYLKPLYSSNETEFTISEENSYVALYLQYSFNNVL